MERPNLYICHTAYQVLVDMVRAMEDAVPPELILSSVIPNTEELAGGFPPPACSAVYGFLTNLPAAMPFSRVFCARCCFSG